ncbi:hypothetical protein D3C85_1610410 [compost metagenome]
MYSLPKRSAFFWRRPQIENRLPQRVIDLGNSRFRFFNIALPQLHIEEEEGLRQVVMQFSR